MSLRKSNLPAHGKITALKQQVENHERISVFIDGEFAFGVWTDQVSGNQLHIGKDLSAAELYDLLDDEEALRVRSAALQYLAYAPRTEYQLRKRLRQKNYSRRGIEGIIQDLRDIGYIDDRKYAMEYVRARFEHKGYGPERIRRELDADGVQHEYINEAIAVCTDPDDLAERARQLLQRFQGRVHGSLPEQKKKLVAYLIRRGYGYMMAKELVQEVLSQSESAESSE